MTQDTLTPAVLLDTCAIIWLVNAGSLSIGALAAIRHAGQSGGVYVSTASAWEIGLLGRPRPGRKDMPQFKPDPKAWFATLMAMPGIKEAALWSDEPSRPHAS